MRNGIEDGGDVGDPNRAELQRMNLNARSVYLLAHLHCFFAKERFEGIAEQLVRFKSDKQTAVIAHPADGVVFVNLKQNAVWLDQAGDADRFAFTGR